MKLPLLSELRQVKSDGKGVITLVFESSDGRAHHVPLKAKVLNALLAPIVSVSKEVVADDGGTLDIQPLTLTSVRTMVGPDGQPALEITLDGIPLRLVLPPAAIPVLYNALDKISGSAASAAPASRH